MGGYLVQMGDTYVNAQLGENCRYYVNVRERNSFVFLLVRLKCLGWTFFNFQVPLSVSSFCPVLQCYVCGWSAVRPQVAISPVPSVCQQEKNNLSPLFFSPGLAAAPYITSISWARLARNTVIIKIIVLSFSNNKTCFERAREAGSKYRLAVCEVDRTVSPSMGFWEGFVELLLTQCH